MLRPRYTRRRPVNVTSFGSFGTFARAAGTFLWKEAGAGGATPDCHPASSYYFCTGYLSAIPIRRTRYTLSIRAGCQCGCGPADSDSQRLGFDNCPRCCPRCPSQSKSSDLNSREETLARACLLFPSDPIHYITRHHSTYLSLA